MSGARRIQHSWHSTPADNFFSSLSTRRRSPRRKFEARIAERADVFHGWFFSPLLIPLAFVDRRTRGIGQVNEQASEHIWSARRKGVAWEIPRALNVSRGHRINGAPSMTTRKRAEMKFYIIQRCPSPSFRIYFTHSSGQVNLYITSALPSQPRTTTILRDMFTGVPNAVEDREE